MALKRVDNFRQNIKVILWGTEIGQLFWNDRTESSYFFFSPDYFRQPYDLTPITCPKNSREARLAIMGDKEDKIFHKLPPFIADSLPDKWGNAIFDKWFNENGYKTKDKTPLTKLSFIGQTAMGALEFLPVLDTGFGSGTIDMPGLYKEAKKLEEELNGKTVTSSENITRTALAALGTSPGGSRSKAIISQRPDGTFVSGKTSLAPENKHYIIKFNTPEYSLSETELTYYQMAILAGIEMMPSRLEIIEGVKHFLTERYDRRNGSKIMTQSFAAINRCDETYEELFRTCRRLGVDVPQMEEMFRRTAFNFLTNNTDDHRKNFSFLMEKNGVWKIAPAYDVTFILDTGNKACDTHCMSLNGKYAGVTSEDLLNFADKQGIKNAQGIIDKIVGATTRFRVFAKENGIRSDIAEIIQERLEKLRPENCQTIKVESVVNLTMKNGQMIQNIRFERSEKGNIHILAGFNKRTLKYVLTSNKEDYQKIIDDGFNGMPESEKKHYAEKYLSPILLKHNQPKLGIN